MTERVIVGTPVPWYRANGWIMQGNGSPDWIRYRLVVLGVCVLTTPWVYVGPLTKDEA